MKRLVDSTMLGKAKRGRHLLDRNHNLQLLESLDHPSRDQAFLAHVRHPFAFDQLLPFALYRVAVKRLLMSRQHISQREFVAGWLE